MINKLVSNIQKTGAPIVVGLDPMLNIYRNIYRNKLLQNMERRLKVRQKQSGYIIKKL